MADDAAGETAARAASPEGNGRAREALRSFSPATGELLGEVPVVAPGDVQGIVDEVARVQRFWAQLAPAARGRYLRRAAQVILDELVPIRDLIAREQGKPRAEALTMELLPTVDALHWIAEAGPGELAPDALGFPQVLLKDKRARVIHEPLGVVGVISPWNYPWTIPLGEVAFALMSGNGVVLKPASLTCLIGQRIADVFEKAGLPDGLLRVVHGGGAVGQALVESSVAKVFFTGSVEVGRTVGETCARALKGSVLELGGKDPMLVLADADLRRTVAGALWGAFANAGQTCAGIERSYVAREVADRFVTELVAGARALRVGDPLRWDTEIGPMTSREQFETVRGLVDDAVAAGARLHCGGPVEVEGLAGPFFAPAVLTGVTHDMRIMREEIFGPVLPVMEVASDEEAVALANDSRFGLGASVWTEDRARGERLAAALEAGMVWVNDHMYTHGAAQTPWGGVKDSGVGRVHGSQGFAECTNTKLVATDRLGAVDLWWHPYDETLGRTLHAAAQLLYGRRDADRRRALRAGARPALRLVGRRLRATFRR
jgi:acyl-CoA reductase-like NAD-dependent aldehyde dehydrogenase